ncbi:integrator complex subunit 4-like [Liolophura sinensis]|uniref:integrator complex subunit 4-like n=1 Tax=Liolophura sinensis TaxID=3198878 RepID=UPI003158DA64
MAALLKKRALAEFSQVIQEEPRPVKKLRLIQKPPSQEINLGLESSTSSQDALQRLLLFEDSLPISSENIAGVVRDLLVHFHREKGTAVRVTIAHLLSKLAKAPGFNCEAMFDEVLPLLKSEKSHKVKGQLLSCLLSIGQSLPLHASIHQQIVSLAKEHLTDTSHLVRSNCLDIIGSLASHVPDRQEESQSNTLSQVQKLLGQFTQDSDPRVRTSAFQAMIQLHQRGLKLEQTLYKQANQALTDDYESVRMAAVKLVWLLCHLYPESPVPVSDSDEELRMVDDGFAKICNMVNDLSVRVRTEAATLLGSLHQVSPKFLEQTLDKKLMSNMRRKRSAHERAKEHYSTGEWSSGQKWADDAPKEAVDPDSINVMSFGACGAFVHGLEDEFLEVRNAALDSLCELAAQSQNFAVLSQDSMIDMFNDEIESVRLNAINSLRKISHQVVLREDQLDIILGVLQDFSVISREALREMLGNMQLATKECLNSCVVALLDNLKRYPQDKESVWKCFQQLSGNHPELTLALVPDLLLVHPYFDTPEPNMDDPAYISILVLVFNSAPHCPTIMPLFQDFIWRHYRYLRDSLPELVPDIQSTCVILEKTDSKHAHSEGSGEFLRQSVKRLECLGSCDLSTAQQLVEITIRDFERVSELDPRESASAECVALFLSTQQALLKISTVGSSSSLTKHIKTLIDKILSACNKLENLYIGLGCEEVGVVLQTELKGMSWNLVHQRSEPTNVGLTASCENIVHCLHKLQRFLSNTEVEPDAFTAQLLKDLPVLEMLRPSVTAKTIQSALPLIKPCHLPLTNHIRKATAVIKQPTGLSDNAVKFTAGLTVSVEVDAILENVQEIQNIRLQVIYPDSETHLLVPKAGDFRKLSVLRHRLISDVVISHSLWSEACHVELSIVVVVPPRSIQSSRGTTQEVKENVLELCKPVKILVLPKPVKR